MPDRPVDLFADLGLVLDREAGASLLGVDPAELDFGPSHDQGEIARDHVIVADHGYYDGAGSGDVINTGDPPAPGEGEVVVEIGGFPKQAYFFGDGVPQPYDLPQEVGDTVIKEAFFSAAGPGGPTPVGPGDQFGAGVGDNASPAGLIPDNPLESFSAPVDLGFTVVAEGGSTQVDVPDLLDEDLAFAPVDVGNPDQAVPDDPVDLDLGFSA
jgi:hypothetical protein